jgi:glycosyltransferase involved in cell wall biosynthesis
MNLVEIFASKTWGGGEQYVFDLSRRMLKDKHLVFFAGRKSEIIERKIASLNQSFLPLSLGGYFNLASVWKLRKLVRREAIDVIHVHHFKAAFLAVWVKILLGGKIKVVLTRHLVRKGKTNFLYRFLYQHIDNLIFVSDLAKRKFLSSHPAINLEKIKVIFNSIYTDEWATDLPRRTADNRFVVGFCGRLEKEKGVEVLLEAIALCKSKNTVFRIAGSGSLETEIKQKAQQFENLQLVGFQENIPKFIAQTDIGVTPTVIEEGFGLVNLEFMAQGKPVITTQNGAQPEYITHNENGLLIEPNNPEQLAHCIDFLAGHPEERTEIGRNALRTFQEKLNYAVFYEKTMRVLQSSVEEIVVQDK